MGFLENFEKGLERVVTGAFSKTFKSELQPVEIAAAIKNEMDSASSILSRERILAPNAFRVRLSSPDFARMRVLGQPLIDELVDLSTRHAQKQKYQFGAGLIITLAEDSSLPIGQIAVASQTQNVAVEWTPAIDVAGQRYLLTKARTVIGRDASADIQVDDKGMSRNHFEVLWDGKNAGVRDLNSTNGTKLDGRVIKESGMKPDSVISAGHSDFVFRVIAKSVTNE
ncbi:MAG: DUF3662 and FHA domain-containing protein [Actinomycetales bacterium]|nr:DUF3662 and FHA domain-containing protein [Actinomycetales bacterium]